MTPAEKRQAKQRKLARQFLDLATELRRVRQRLANIAASTRPDLQGGNNAYAMLRAHGIEWACTLYELAARLALPPWMPPAERTQPETPIAEEPAATVEQPAPTPTPADVPAS